jgi:hypothetical protein
MVNKKACGRKGRAVQPLVMHFTDLFRLTYIRCQHHYGLKFCHIFFRISLSSRAVRFELEDRAASGLFSRITSNVLAIFW